MKGNKLVRFGISMEEDLLSKFDAAISKKNYHNRSEAMRDLIREYLVEEEWDENREVAGTITLVYDHEVRELSDRLTELQHEYHTAIRSTLHIHLDAHCCLEVLVVVGRGNEIRTIADRLIGTRGVKHGRLTTTTAGKGI